MRTKKQIEASRRNARKSTGPRTAQGKAASSMNALRHGLRARTVVLPGENQEDFDQLHAALQDQYQPQTPSEQLLVDQAAIAQWKLVRAEAFEAQTFAGEPDPKARLAAFDRITQVQCRLERAFFKAYKELDRIKTAREKQSAQPAAKKADDVPPARYQVNWVDSSGGTSEVLYRAENGVPVKEFSEASPPTRALDP